jgi:hypothetical protein
MPKPLDHRLAGLVETHGSDHSAVATELQYNAITCIAGAGAPDMRIAASPHGSGKADDEM